MPSHPERSSTLRPTPGAGESYVPKSVTSSWINLVGLGTLIGATVIVLRSGMDPLWGALLCLGCYALPVGMLEVLILKVHCRESTGLDWSRLKRGRTNWDRVTVKLAGLLGTVGAVVLFHALLRLYDLADMRTAATMGALVFPAFILLAIPYAIVIDRIMLNPEDGYLHAGSLFLGRLGNVDWPTLREHALGWMIKGFFLPIMLVYLLQTIGHLQYRLDAAALDPFAAVNWLAQYAVALELCVVCVGYTCTFRAVDSHIRSPNPFLGAWVVTLACYEPFNQLVSGRALQYRDGMYWSDWFAGLPVLAIPWAVALLASFAVWVWATTIYGLRWSNLTHRGIITNGPYRFTKHPDYVAKSLFFWLTHVPFLSAGGPLVALKMSLLLAFVNLIYFARARTEERHLAQDPVYVAYALAMNERSIFRGLARLLPGLRFRAPHDGRAGPSQPAPLTPAFLALEAVVRRWRWRLPMIVLAILGLLLFGTAVANKKDGLDFELRRAVTQFMDAEHIPGAVLAYGRAGAHPTIVPLGHADLVGRRPMLADLRFRLASLSKPITAAAIMELVQDGVLDLEDRLSDIVPEISAAPDARHREITVRHLLQHTAGWNREQDIDPFFVSGTACAGFPFDRATSGEVIARAMLQRPLQTAPGCAQAYSNLGYVWLQEIVTRLAGVPYEAFVQERLFAPMGIRSLQLGEGGLPASEMVARFQAHGTRVLAAPNNETDRTQLLKLGGAGGWIGTAADYFRFAVRPLPAETLEPPAFIAPDQDYYGLGWRVWPEANGSILTHSGFMPGVFSMVARFPDDLVVVTLFNGGVVHGQTAMERLLEYLRAAVQSSARGHSAARS